MNHRAVVSVILQSSSWKQGLRVSYPPHANKGYPKLISSQQSRSTMIDHGKLQDDDSIYYGTTPFRELIKSMPGAYNIVHIFHCDKAIT